MGKHTLLETKAYDPTDAVFGLTQEGETFHTPLSKGPHWIVAGQTGSGKSVYMNSLLISIMAHSTPDELTLFTIDPKKVEFGPYKGLPFCGADPITEMTDAYGLLLYQVWLMDERYKLLKDAGVKNIEEYNEWFTEHKDKEGEKPRACKIPHERMKYMVSVIDEYADLVMQERECEDLIVRLAQKARACGITLLIATQRPSADIISPTIKANVPARIGLKTTDGTNSMIVIDEGGLEKLRGYGDSIVKLVDGTMVRIQGPYISNPEIDRIFEYFKANYPAPNPVDFKQICVDEGLAQWADDYADDVPYDERHIKKARRSRF
jgi:DNA segregation ATPase FtsK/SpoIIIE-like protein